MQPTSLASAAGRRFTPADRLMLQLDHGLRTLFGAPHTTERPNPAADLAELELSPRETRLSGALMRVNHAGEVSAQALYQGQALTARLPKIRRAMERAALEENDHLDWCERRCEELGTHTSVLGPFWYLGSLTIGAAAGAVGDKWSLGFVVETERQVVKHLDEHLQRLPPRDLKSRAILTQMKEDEEHHATTALEGGAAPLPAPVKRVMTMISKVMTGLAFRI
jgi:ubiquinone biosynthesis monooxygenase Coq7